MMCKAWILMLIFSTLLVGGCTIGPRKIAVNTPIHNGQIVLLRKGTNCYGVFIPIRQRMQPEQLQCTWYYRTDGKGTFKSSESAQYKSGSGGDGSDSATPYGELRFGPFSLGWSGNEDGQGYIYYSHFEGESVSPNDERICVTNETDIEKIDATDPKWVYKGSPTDPGIRANGQKILDVRPQ